MPAPHPRGSVLFSAGTGDRCRRGDSVRGAVAAPPSYRVERSTWPVRLRPNTTPPGSGSALTGSAEKGIRLPTAAAEISARSESNACAGGRPRGGLFFLAAAPATAGRRGDRAAAGGAAELLGRPDRPPVRPRAQHCYAAQDLLGIEGSARKGHPFTYSLRIFRARGVRCRRRTRAADFLFSGGTGDRWRVGGDRRLQLAVAVAAELPRSNVDRPLVRPRPTLATLRPESALALKTARKAASVYLLANSACARSPVPAPHPRWTFFLAAAPATAGRRRPRWRRQAELRWPNSTRRRRGRAQHCYAARICSALTRKRSWQKRASVYLLDANFRARESRAGAAPALDFFF